MKKKIAIITGINGQDGAYLAQKLIQKNVKVFGILRRGSTPKNERLLKLNIHNKIEYLRCDLTEHQTVQYYIEKIKPNYIYNLAAQSFVQYSFETPFNTFKVNFEAVLNILETLRKNNFKKCKFYQASTSEMFGNVNANKNKKINLSDRFQPISPYATSKLFSHYLVKLYRDSYGLYTSTGILFNHESPLRGSEFVTKKIVENLVNQKFKNGPVLKLGNIDAARDWGHAKDYVDSMIKILNQKKPDDYIIASGKLHSVREFFLIVVKILGFKPEFIGKGFNEICIDQKSKKILMKISKRYYRDNDLFNLKGDSSIARKKLKWKPKYTFKKMIKEMIDSEIEQLN